MLMYHNYFYIRSKKQLSVEGCFLLKYQIFGQFK